MVNSQLDGLTSKRQLLFRLKLRRIAQSLIEGRRINPSHEPRTDLAHTTKSGQQKDAQYKKPMLLTQKPANRPLYVC